VPLDRDHRTDTDRDPAAEREVSNTDRDDLQCLAFFGPENELG
jgi:hypothetical protein